MVYRTVLRLFRVICILEDILNKAERSVRHMLLEFILRMLNKDWSHLTPNEIALLNT